VECGPGTERSLVVPLFMAIGDRLRETAERAPNARKSRGTWWGTQYPGSGSAGGRKRYDQAALGAWTALHSSGPLPQRIGSIDPLIDGTLYQNYGNHKRPLVMVDSVLPFFSEPFAG
jgi:hypothetical protein